MKNGKVKMEELLEALLSIKEKRALQDFLEGILTPKELLEIPRRLQVIKMLKRGMPQHQIAKELGIGIATVTRGSKELQKGHFKGI